MTMDTELPKIACRLHASFTEQPMRRHRERHRPVLQVSEGRLWLLLPDPQPRCQSLRTQELFRAHHLVHAALDQGEANLELREDAVAFEATSEVEGPMVKLRTVEDEVARLRALVMVEVDLLLVEVVSGEARASTQNTTAPVQTVSRPYQPITPSRKRLHLHSDPATTRPQRPTHAANASGQAANPSPNQRQHPPAHAPLAALPNPQSTPSALIPLSLTSLRSSKADRKWNP